MARTRIEDRYSITMPLTARIGQIDLEPGDAVHLELTLVEKRPSSKPGRGIAIERGALVKSDGTLVTSGDHAIVLLFAPPAAKR